MDDELLDPMLMADDGVGEEELGEDGMPKKPIADDDEDEEGAE